MRRKDKRIEDKAISDQQSAVSDQPQLSAMIPRLKAES